MRKWLRRIRGAVGLGLAWAAAHFVVGVGFALVTWEFGVYAFGNGFLWIAYNSLISAATGFIGGGVFSTILGLADGRRRFDQLSLARFVAWGALGGGLVAAGLSNVIGWGTPSLALNLSIMGALGAACAAGTLTLARAADDRELLESGERVSRTGLTDAEASTLLSGR